MKFEKEINFYDTPAVARKFSAQDTSLEAINGKISKIISDTQLTQYDNGQNTMASALNAAVSTATQNAQTLSTLQTSFDTKSGEFDTFKADYNDQLSTTTQKISTIGSVAASKGKIFSAQPSIPYQVNDIWLKNGQNGSEIYRCITAKTDAENDVFSNDDWVKATSYATSAELGSLSSTVSQIQQTANSVSLKVQASNNTHKLSDIVNGENYDMGDFVISESGVKRVTVEPNRDGNGNAIYRSTDLSDVTNEIPTSSEISTAIDNGISNATINADKINFNSYSLDLTTKRMEIRSDKFSVNPSGVVKAKALQIDGKYTTYANRPYINFPFTYYGRHNNSSDYFMLDDSGLVINGKGTQMVLAPYCYGDHDVWTDSYGYGHEELFKMYGNGSSGYDYSYGSLKIADNHIDFDFKQTYDDSSAYLDDHNDSWICAKSLYAENLKIKGGTKNKVIATENYGDISMYSYETASPMYGDIGEGKTDETGVAYIYFSPKYLETVNTNMRYQVFLQKYGEGDLYVAERNTEYFVVKGTPNTEFGWESKHYQGDINFRRTDNPEFKPGLHYNKEYGIMADKYIENITKERISSHESSNISDDI
jgi:hypothetical protein